MNKLLVSLACAFGISAECQSDTAVEETASTITLETIDSITRSVNENYRYFNGKITFETADIMFEVVGAEKNGQQWLCQHRLAQEKDVPSQKLWAWKTSSFDKNSADITFTEAECQSLKL